MNFTTIAVFIVYMWTVEGKATKSSNIFSSRSVGVPLEHQHHTYALDKLRAQYVGKYIGAGDVKSSMEPRKAPRWARKKENREKIKYQMENLRKAYAKLNELRQLEAGDTQGWFYGTK